MLATVRVCPMMLAIVHVIVHVTVHVSVIVLATVLVTAPVCLEDSDNSNRKHFRSVGCCNHGYNECSGEICEGLW